MSEPELPNPRFSPKPPPPLMDHAYSTLGWLHRAAAAVGSERFEETISRTAFCFTRAAHHAHTPGEAALVTGLQVAIDELVTADAQARTLLADSVSGMDAAEACEFVEMCEAGEQEGGGRIP
jgi:hypothetical protein